jgi:hypothetical protein
MYRLLRGHLFVFIIFMAMGKTMAADHKLITHTSQETFDLNAHIVRLKSTPNLILPLEEELAILDQLTQFNLGKYLLENKRINGYWTAFWVIHGPQQKLEHPLENWLINKAPSFLASQQRFKVFRQIMQKNLRLNMRLASIPCGLMDDLLGLDYSLVQNVEVDGYDLDPESLDLATKNAQKYKTGSAVSFHNKDAWHLDAKETYDIITSNGLNFYEADDQKVERLYKEFYQA